MSYNKDIKDLIFFFSIFSLTDVPQGKEICYKRMNLKFYCSSFDKVAALLQAQAWTNQIKVAEVIWLLLLLLLLD